MAQCRKWSEVKEAQSCPTLCDPMDYVVHRILQARILEWVAFPFSSGSSQPMDRTHVSRIAGGFFTSWATQAKHVINSKREGARDLASVGSRKWEVLSVYTSLWEAQGPDSLKSEAGSSALTLEIRMLGLLKTHPLGAAPPHPQGDSTKPSIFLDEGAGCAVGPGAGWL